jgi:ABC-2 type transport system permease protein
MILVSAWIMLLATLRDRAALVMSFILPPLLFAVFAAIFSGTSGTELKIKVGILDQAHSATNQRLIEALQTDHNFRFIIAPSGDAATLADTVRRGMVDVGLLLRGDLAVPVVGAAPPILIVENSARPLAASIAGGLVQRILSEKLPDVVLGRVLGDIEASGALTDDQIGAIAQKFHPRPDDGLGLESMIQRQVADGDGAAHNGNVLYYAGAVVAVFLLFAAVHGAMSLLDELNTGIIERLRLGASGLAALLAGKFCYLTLQGLIQAIIVYLSAYLLYGAAFAPSRLGVWLVSCVLAASAAAASALFLCALCRSRKQAETLTTFVVLLMSAIGGSMVPRYLMPPWFQEIGWFTPNAWMIQGFDLAVQPSARLADLLLPWGILAGIVLVTGAGSWRTVRRAAL